ncbi:MAG TPA: oxidoreductase [Steroidobacteraceae bacterium]
MDKAFRAFRIHSEGGRPVARFEQISLADLSAGAVVIRVTHSGINYKDALAATGAGKILRRYPLVGGIDLAGVVESSEDARYAAGDAVLVTGCALSETHDGGYAQFARVPGDWVIPLPAGLSAFEAMAIGTAGFTAAFAIDRMEQNGQAPQGGPIVVTGASGGVGSIAVDMLSARGYRIFAVSGKAAAAPYLRELGAHEVLARQELDLGSRALETARFGGAIDNLGGEVLTWLTRTVDFWGNIASIGLAAGAELNTTVMPFILRGVSLLGINSSATPRARRIAVWQRIGTDLRPRHLARIVTRTIEFDELPSAFPAHLEGAVTGRTVVRIG